MYKILIITNTHYDESIEDKLLKKRFESDGHLVDLKWINYDSKLDEFYDIIIRRNSWIEEETDINKYKKYNTKLINRLKNKEKAINIVGLDGIGKSYLKDFYYKGLDVIPTTDILSDALKWNCDEFVLKLRDSYGSGIGQLFVNKKELEQKYNSEYLIQPKLNFKSEIQAYFINDELMYTYEYSPSKWPNYPTPKLINLSSNEKRKAEGFADLSSVKIGMKRIDFLRLFDDSLILLEIEDNSPYMNIDMLPKELQHKVLDYYVNGIYQHIERALLKK